MTCSCLISRMCLDPVPVAVAIRITLEIWGVGFPPEHIMKIVEVTEKSSRTTPSLQSASLEGPLPGLGQSEQSGAWLRCQSPVSGEPAHVLPELRLFLGLLLSSVVLFLLCSYDTCHMNLAPSILGLKTNPSWNAYNEKMEP